MKSVSSLQKTFMIPSFQISVIIPTYESAEALKRCLLSLKEQSHPIGEIVVVDSFSKDNTREIASGLGAKVILMSSTQAAARNAGLANSKGDYVLFLDSDQQLDSGVVENCVLKCIVYGAEAAKIPEDFVGLTFWSKCSALWKNSMVRAWGSSGGIPRFYRRDMLIQFTGFNDKLRFWEDMELYQRLRLEGLREVWCRSHVTHYETDSLPKVIRKYVSYGRSISAFRRNSSKAPCASTARLTLSTIMQLLRAPGGSVSVFLGCLFLVVAKALAVMFGFLSRFR